MASKKAIVLLLFTGVSTAQRIECATSIQDIPKVDGLAANMLESNIARGQGIGVSTASTKFIEMGLFQQSLRESIAYTNDAAQKARWGEYLQDSLASVICALSDPVNNTGLSLDRFSIGSNMIRQYLALGNQSFLAPIQALTESATLQQRNANGALWYYANPANLSFYQNLSYIDGMHSYPTFAILSDNPSSTTSKSSPGTQDALKQLEILRNITRREDGLLVHGYDAIKEHSWANPTTGASPAVWARALAWYTLGTLEALELMLDKANPAATTLKAIFNDLVRAQLTASDRSLAVGGVYGVWQIVDYPGATFAGVENFIEASASCMTAYSFLKGVRLGLIDNKDIASRLKVTGIEMYKNVLDKFWINNCNGTTSLNGTSSVASLAGDVDFTYYASRPTVLNSLIGTSAFTLASLEVERLC